MVKANENTQVVWSYQSAADNIENMDAATDVTYLFGEYDDDCGKWEVPSLKHDAPTYHNYNVRTPKISVGNRKINPWKHTWNPITPQYLNWFLKNPTDGSPDTIVALETGLWATPLSIRIEELEGTVPTLLQMVDCYCNNLYCRAMIGKPFLVECEFTYGRLEDYRGREMYRATVSNTATPKFDATGITLTANEADDWQVWVRDGTDEGTTYEIISHEAQTTPEITLAEAHSLGNGDLVIFFNKTRPFFTNDPRNAGHTTVSGIYDSFEVIWDDGDADTALTECWKAEWSQSQTMATVMDANNRYQTSYHYQYSPVQLTLSVILETGKQITDYLDREVRELEVKVKKGDGTNYVSHVFTNCHIIDETRTGVRTKGHYEAIILMSAEKQEGSFVWEGTDTWANHFK